MTADTHAQPRTIFGTLRNIFFHSGPLPILLILALIIFSSMSENFLTERNITNVLRQSTFLIIVAMGQMLPLVTGGFDLSVGTTLALTSVVSATVMSDYYQAYPEAAAVAIVLGILAGLCAGLVIGLINGIGVAVFDVSPFMMTLGVSSIGFGAALYMTGGIPVYGMPTEFSDIFGFGDFLGIATPIWVTAMLIILMFVFMNWTRIGRYFYAVGGNIKASKLSGVNTRGMLFLAYVICGTLTAVAGLLLTARLETGEANIGAAFPLQSIAACVIGGVSLRGGRGRVENVVLAALFIGLIQNGMNLARMESYLQTVVIGILLIVAVAADQIRLRLVYAMRD